MKTREQMEIQLEHTRGWIKRYRDDLKNARIRLDAMESMLESLEDEEKLLVRELSEEGLDKQKEV